MSPDVPPLFENDSDFLEVPVTNQFDISRPIGTLRINRHYLPKTPTYLFAIGGVVRDGVEELNGDQGETVFRIREFELTEVALIPEDQYDWQKAKDVWYRESPVETVESVGATPEPKPAGRKKVNTKPNVGGA